MVASKFLTQSGVVEEGGPSVQRRTEQEVITDRHRHHHSILARQLTDLPDPATSKSWYQYAQAHVLQLAFREAIRSTIRCPDPQQPC